MVLRGIGKSFQSAITAPRISLTGYGNATAQSWLQGDAKKTFKPAMLPSLWYLTLYKCKWHFVNFSDLEKCFLSKLNERKVVNSWRGGTQSTEIFSLINYVYCNSKETSLADNFNSAAFSCKIDDSRDSTNLIPQSLNILASCKTFTDLPVSIALVHWLLNFSRTVVLPDGETAPLINEWKKKQRK